MVNRSRTRRWIYAATLAGGLALGTRALEAQACPVADPTGVPVKPSPSNPSYFLISGWGPASPQGTLALVGLSYEYLCHVKIPSTLATAGQYCDLSTYDSVFTTLRNDGNNVVRINAIFNSSPGLSELNLVNGVYVPSLYQRRDLPVDPQRREPGHLEFERG
jgi:hypothetical protein